MKTKKWVVHPKAFLYTLAESSQVLEVILISVDTGDMLYLHKTGMYTDINKLMHTIEKQHEGNKIPDKYTLQ